ncbi:hypothetical protein AAP_00056 [Ascosphaera apis ARSEF 7405]|uniref:Uncharacterized protein n=1 Tax=Ascosphaera apis ARSEF 7405 TaxID=392613 RepID=A0A168DIZ1_9EURO|nr:hypothetical protein AAP_00056 [Ascosphaera apis ARSEF 7405]
MAEEQIRQSPDLATARAQPDDPIQDDSPETDPRNATAASPRSPYSTPAAWHDFANRESRTHRQGRDLSQRPASTQASSQVTTEQAAIETLDRRPIPTPDRALHREMAEDMTAGDRGRTQLALKEYNHAVHRRRTAMRDLREAHRQIADLQAYAQDLIRDANQSRGLAVAAMDMLTAIRARAANQPAHRARPPPLAYSRGRGQSLGDRVSFPASLRGRGRGRHPYRG